MEEKFGKILAVCANADYQDNKHYSERIIAFLLEKKYIPDIAYEFISVNPENPKNRIVYDKHISGYFGGENFPELPQEYYDVIIFQSCMTCVPNSASVYALPLAIPTAYKSLKKGGVFINTESCYYATFREEDKGYDRNKVEKVLKHIGNIPASAIGKIRDMEIWKKS